MTNAKAAHGLRFSLGLKIGLGFAVGAAITVAVGVVGLLGLNRIATTIDKTGIANQAFVSINDLHQSFADYLASRQPADAHVAEAKIKIVLDTIGALDNGDENFVKARQALDDLKLQIDAVGKSTADLKSALADIDQLSQKMSSSIDQIATQADKISGDAASDEHNAVKMLNTLNTVNPLVDQFTATALKSAAFVQKLAATGEQSVSSGLTSNVDALSNIISGIVTVQLDPSIPATATAIKALIASAKDDLAGLLKSLDKARAADASADEKRALTEAANKLSYSFEAIANRANSIRLAYVSVRNNAIKTLQLAGQKRSSAGDVSFVGQRTSQSVAALILATKDFMANAGRSDPKGVTDLIAKLLDMAKDNDAAGSTTGLADTVTKYGAAFQNILSALANETRSTKSAETAANTAVASISAISSRILADTASTTSFQRILALATLAFGCIVTLIFATVTARSVRNPINALTRIMARLAAGDTDVNPPGSDRSDEIGEMSRTVEVFRDAAIEKRRLETDANRDAAERADRQARIDAMIREFRADVERMLAGVAAQTEKMQGTAQRLNQAADYSQRQVQSASGASTEASENVSTVAASAEELAASVNEIAARVEKTVAIVGTASAQASDSNTRIASLAQSATRIGDVVKLIRSIADQTNLLALNATIEAARAGTAGKGFAVVAAEVKQLADQTAKATQEIATQVEGIQSATRDAVQSIGGIATSMHSVNDFTASIAAAVSQQGSATSEISRNAHGASQGTQMVAQSMDTLVKTSQDTTEAAGEVNSVAREVSAANATLTRTIDTFLETVAAA